MLATLAFFRINETNIYRRKDVQLDGTIIEHRELHQVNDCKFKLATKFQYLRFQYKIVMY